MSNPNDTQVGGVHYKASYETWDFTLDVVDGCFFLGNAIKYVSRWRKKNGKEDLAKAKHYLQKHISLQEAGRIYLPAAMSTAAREAVLGHYCQVQGLYPDDKEILDEILRGRLSVAILCIDDLLSLR